MAYPQVHGSNKRSKFKETFYKSLGIELILFTFLDPIIHFCRVPLLNKLNVQATHELEQGDIRIGSGHTQIL